MFGHSLFEEQILHNVYVAARGQLGGEDGEVKCSSSRVCWSACYLAAGIC
jgi:hypothetical protein